MQQVANIKEIFSEYFKVAETPDRIIELGTMTGNLSMIIYNLRKEISEDFDYITIDIRRDIKMELLPKNMIYCQMDIFNNLEFIGHLIKPQTLILCDNGDKVKEINKLAKYLKPHCVMMAHDYSHDRETFNPDGVWAHCEITWADVEKLGLHSYHQDIMDNGAWLSLTNIE